MAPWTILAFDCARALLAWPRRSPMRGTTIATRLRMTLTTAMSSTRVKPLAFLRKFFSFIRFVLLVQPTLAPPDIRTGQHLHQRIASRPGAYAVVHLTGRQYHFRALFLEYAACNRILNPHVWPWNGRTVVTCDRALKSGGSHSPPN